MVAGRRMETWSGPSERFRPVDGSRSQGGAHISDKDIYKYAIGYTYDLSKRTAIYGNVAYTDYDDEDVARFMAIPTTVPTVFRSVSPTSSDRRTKTVQQQKEGFAFPALPSC